MQGTGQGSGASHVVWFAITVTLLRALVEAGVTTNFTAPLSDLITEFAAILFVDDTDFYINATSEDDRMEYIMTRAQKAMNVWSALLRATGGALRPGKCRWCVADFCWSGGDPHYKKLNDIAGELFAHDTNLNYLPVRRIDIHQGLEILGVILQMDGKDTSEVTRIHEADLDP